MEPDEDLLALGSTVPVSYDGVTLIEYLTRRFTYHDETNWRDEIGQRRLKVNGLPPDPLQTLKKGDSVVYETLHPEPPVNKAFTILHEDEHLLVVDKPAPLPCHANGRYIRNTLFFLLSEHLRRKGFTGRAWLTHRLDTETSGVMVVAKTKQAMVGLMRDFAQRKVKKQYLAVVQGTVERDKFTVDDPILKRDLSQSRPNNAAVAKGTPGSKPAITVFQVVRRLEGMTLVKAEPKTGRTHQIRLHLAAIGHPVVGDKLNQPSNSSSISSGRQLLHAWKLNFHHPMTGQAMVFVAPIPGDMFKAIGLQDSERLEI